MKSRFDVTGMTCASCQAHVERAVSKLKGVRSCSVSLLTNTLDVEYDENILTIEEIISSVEKGGYHAFLQDKNPNNPAKRQSKSKKQQQIDRDLLSLIVALIFLFLLMYVSMGHMISLPLPSFLQGKENALVNALTQLLFTLPSLFLFRHYFLNGFKRLLHLEPNMDSLVAIGSFASLIYGIVAIFLMAYGLGHGDFSLIEKYQHSFYFDSAAMILTFVSLGKYLEKCSKKKTTKAIEELMDLAPKKALLWKENKEIEVSLEEVKVGDIFILKKGDIVPVDGTILEGKGSFMEANITGESFPSYKEKDQEIFSSTILQSGYIKARADKVGEDTSIQTIIRLVKEAADSKAPISKLVDKISLYFVPAILLISLATFIGWISSGVGFESSFNFAISVLVIACPCALGLATPLAIMVSSGKGAQSGLLIRNAEILERVHLVKKIVFDKTGTITKGEIVLTDYVNLTSEDTYPYVQAIENESEHPLAKAITSYKKGESPFLVHEFRSLDGVGLEGIIGEDLYQIGNRRSLSSALTEEIKKKVDFFEEEGKTVLFVSKNHEIVAICALKDEVKEEAKEAIYRLKKMGIAAIMLTGDNEKTAKSIAKEVGIDEVYAEVYPEEKGKIISSLKKKEKELVAMVGDGVNDAIALTASDLGIAIGAGSDIAKESADIILLRNSLLDVINVVSLSKRTLLTIKTGLFWALFYNCIGILFAMGVFYYPFSIVLSPMIASIAMSCSSLFVVFNALTINLWKPLNKETKEENCPLVLEYKEERKEKGGEEKMEIKVKGMMCQMCVKHVKTALERVSGVTHVDVSLEKGIATIDGTNLDKDALLKAIKEAGYEGE